MFLGGKALTACISAYIRPPTGWALPCSACSRLFHELLGLGGCYISTNRCKSQLRRLDHKEQLRAQCMDTQMDPFMHFAMEKGSRERGFMEDPWIFSWILPCQNGTRIDAGCCCRSRRKVCSSSKRQTCWWSWAWSRMGRFRSGRRSAPSLASSTPSTSERSFLSVRVHS
jgi:hypothetical protein